ncbi:hypothetical protein [Parasphingorhabdus pacifica]
MRSEASSPGENATTVRYRFGWGMFAGALGLCSFVGLFVYYLVTPDQAAREFNPIIPWIMIAVVGPFALLMLAGALFMLSRTHRVDVDDRGMWFIGWGATELVSWSELQAVRAREPQPKEKENADSRALSAAVEFFPDDSGFTDRHRRLVKADASGACIVDLPGRGTVQRLARAVSTHRPELLRPGQSAADSSD